MNMLNFDSMNNELWFWIAFHAGVLCVLAIDLFGFQRKAHVPTMKEASIWTGIWLSHIYHIPTPISLSVVALVLLTAIALLWRRTVKDLRRLSRPRQLAVHSGGNIEIRVCRRNFL